MDCQHLLEILETGIKVIDLLAPTLKVVKSDSLVVLVLVKLFFIQELISQHCPRALWYFRVYRCWWTNTKVMTPTGKWKNLALAEKTARSSVKWTNHLEHLTGLTIAEYFRDVEGQDVSITSSVSLKRFWGFALGRMPSAVGYQPTLRLLKWVNCKNVSHQLKVFCCCPIQATTFQLTILTQRQLQHLLTWTNNQPWTGAGHRVYQPLTHWHQAHVPFHLEIVGEEHYAVATEVQRVLNVTVNCKILSLSLVWMNCWRTLVGRCRILLVTKLNVAGTVLQVDQVLMFQLLKQFVALKKL